VQVLATGPVVEVAYELDGREVVRLSGSQTWKQDVDFGTEYVPHELVARGFDVKGREIALARQWINLPRAPAEVEIVLEKDKKGRATGASLTWASRMGPHPTSVTLTFDGLALPLDVTHHAGLPAYDPTLAHVLSAQVDFPGDLHGHADLVLGGGKADEAGSELTAIPVHCESAMPSSAESLQGRFRKGGEPLKIMAVEHGPAAIMVVRDLREDREALRHVPPNDPSSWRKGTMLEKDDRLQVFWPVASEVPDRDAFNELFDASHVFEGSSASFSRALLRVTYPEWNGTARRFADAVAVAAVSAAGTGSRRAVVLVLGASDWDYSRRDPASIRRYLERIHVPLYVWSLEPERPPSVVPASVWGQFEDISTAKGFRSAVDRVLEDVKKQSVVWIEGRHLPQDITLTDTGDGMVIAR
jgi:hypothetical protein